MVVILLSPFLCKSDTLILKLHQKKSSYLDARCLFIGRFKVKSVPGMRNKHFSKIYFVTKISNFITLGILKKEGR